MGVEAMWERRKKASKGYSIKKIHISQTTSKINRLVHKFNCIRVVSIGND